MSTVSSLESNATFENETMDKRLRKEKLIYNTLSEGVKRKLDQVDNQNTFVKIFPLQNGLDKENNDQDFFEITEMTKNFNIPDKQKYFSKIQKWVGYVLEIHGNNIKAKLNDLNNPTTHEIAEFEMNEVPYEDRELVLKGAGFYWSLGYVN